MVSALLRMGASDLSSIDGLDAVRSVAGYSSAWYAMGGRNGLGS